MHNFTYRKRQGGKMMNKLAFIGAGNIAEALISGIVENKLLNEKQIWVTNRSNEEKLKNIQNQYGEYFI